MYRIFCESYKNFINSFGKDEENYRIKIAKPFELIIDLNKYNEEKAKESIEYKKIEDLIFYMESNVSRFPKFKAFLWTLASRGIVGKKYNESNEEELEEQAKLTNSFLKLAYWF